MTKLSTNLSRLRDLDNVFLNFVDLYGFEDKEMWLNGDIGNSNL